MTHENAKQQWAKRQIETANDWANIVSVADDMNMMHAYYDIHKAMEKLSPAQVNEFLSFRFRFLQEEVNEGFKAIEEKDADGYIDSIVDLVVVAVGTLDLLGVDFDIAWKEVLKANMNKRVGIKASRPNPLSLPDLIKEPGWVAPSHEDNLGIIQQTLNHES